jgi:hypothetical protein
VTDPAALFALLALATLGLAIAAAALLRAWQGWLALRRLELGGGVALSNRPPPRIEIADLKDRVRRLEAIADGVER